MCEICWKVFTEEAKRCPGCGYPVPEAGWSRLPLRYKGRFWLVEQIAQTSVGAIFRVFDEERDFMEGGGDPPWALKVIQTILAPAAQREVVDSFINEARASALLADNGDVTVPVVEHGQDEQPFTLMPYITWPTAAAWLKEAHLTPLRAAQVGRALLYALSKIHALNVIHCDLKPGNIFIKEAQDALGFAIKISDFGLWVRDLDSTLSTSMSTPALRGTVGYMSPEQMEGLPLGKRSDIHAVGSILWELATGEPPFIAEGPTITDRIQGRKVLLKTPPAHPKGMPHTLYAILTKALAYEPRERWDSAVEMAEALKGFISKRLSEAFDRLSIVEARTRILEDTMAGLPQNTSEIHARWDLIEEINRGLEDLRALIKRKDVVAFDAALLPLKQQINGFEAMLNAKADDRLKPDVTPMEPEITLTSGPEAKRRPWITALVGLLAFGAGVFFGRLQQPQAPAPEAAPNAALGASALEAPEPQPTPSAPEPVARLIEAPDAAPPAAAPPLRLRITTTPSDIPIFDAEAHEELAKSPHTLSLSAGAPAQLVYFKRDDGRRSHKIKIQLNAEEGYTDVHFDLQGWIQEMERYRERQARTKRTRGRRAEVAKEAKPEPEPSPAQPDGAREAAEPTPKPTPKPAKPRIGIIQG